MTTATDFANPDAIRRLQARAADGDLANRIIISPLRAGSDPTPAGPQCACGALLTIADRWSVCRDCRSPLG